MPKINEQEFEIFCKDCGKGICNSVIIRYSKNRKMPQILVPSCQICSNSLVSMAERKARMDVLKTFGYK